MSSRHTQHDERAQLDLFRALPGDLAPRDAQDLMAYPFFSLAKSKRLTPIDFKAGSVKIRVEAVPEHGMATIWDADVLIWAASVIGAFLPLVDPGEAVHPPLGRLTDGRRHRGRLKPIECGLETIIVSRAGSATDEREDFVRRGRLEAGRLQAGVARLDDL